MTPYADFIYFGLLLYVVVPTLVLGWLGWAGWRWALFVTAAMLLVQYWLPVPIAGGTQLRGIWLLLGFAAWQWATVRLYAGVGARAGWPFYCAIAVSLLPLAAAKIVPLLGPAEVFGFLGISYVTFRALDLIFCLRDKVIALPGALDLFTFLFFFPTISAGPIDRYRRFAIDWRKLRTREDFLRDLDDAVHRIFRGFLYKFILAALIKRYWLTPVAAGLSIGALASYMYAYSFYLFFDFAGYSAFAIGLSYLLGVHTPENFDRPFLARNIRDFWNRWHITLSFWFRDHVYMRFLLAATRGKWFAHKDAAAISGYFLTFGLMGLWHGIEWHYIAYGLYQATLLSGFHLFVRWNKTRRIWGEGRFWHAAAVALTFQSVCFGLLIFSGHIAPWLSAQNSHRVNRPHHQICRSGIMRQRSHAIDPKAGKRKLPNAQERLCHRSVALRSGTKLTKTIEQGRSAPVGLRISRFKGRFFSEHVLDHVIAKGRTLNLGGASGLARPPASSSRMASKACSTCGCIFSRNPPGKLIRLISSENPRSA